MLEALDLAAHRVVFIIDFLQRFVTHKPKLMTDGRKALVGVVLPQDQAVLAAARHHAVGLVRPLGHKVIDERADVGLLAA